MEIFYEDTDMGGVVYYANYLKYFERARTGLLRNAGIEPAWWAKNGVTFAVAKAEINYKKPAVYGDLLMVNTGVTIVGSVRLKFEYEIVRGKELLVTGQTIMACVSGKMKPRRIPEEIVNAVKKFGEKN